MNNFSPGGVIRKDRLAFWILAGLLILFWIAGGASRADVTGQVLVRAGAWLALVLIVALDLRPNWKLGRSITYLTLAAIALPALQLVPLPPVAWNSLPGHHALAESARLSGDPNLWRPMSLSPGGTRNALGSLVVALVVLILALRLPREWQWRLASFLLALVVASSVVAVLQFSGAAFDNPFHNEVRGEVSGSFANRNHFALFAALGCTLAIVLGLRDSGAPTWKIATSIGLVVLFSLVALSTGSRTGTVLVASAIALSILAMRREIQYHMRGQSRAFVASAALFAGLLLIAAILTSVVLGRAVAFDRASDLASGEDLRWRALPTLLEMTWKYFPTGAGFGTFDPVFRIDEPTSFLSPRYFNLAHNDILQVVLEGGIAGIGMLAFAIFFWAKASLWAWKGSGSALNRLGSILTFLVIFASVTDYPARTPMIMAVTIVSSIWLVSRGQSREPHRSGEALPPQATPL